MDLQGAVASAFMRLNDAYDGAVEQLLTEVVNPTIEAFNTNKSDPTHGSVYYGHVSYDKFGSLQVTIEYYKGAYEQFRYQRFESERRSNPFYLIVNNYTALP